LQKLNFGNEYSASADTFIALCLIIGKYKTTVIPNMLQNLYAASQITASKRRGEANDVSILSRHSS